VSLSRCVYWCFWWNVELSSSTSWFFCALDNVTSWLTADHHVCCSVTSSTKCEPSAYGDVYEALAPPLKYRRCTLGLYLCCGLVHHVTDWIVVNTTISWFCRRRQLCKHHWNLDALCCMYHWWTLCLPNVITGRAAPSVYVLNAAAVTKPHAT